MKLKHQMVRLAVRVPRPMARNLKLEAQRREVSKNDLVRTALERLLTDRDSQSNQPQPPKENE